MIDDLLLIDDPNAETIVVLEHVLRPDGSVHLVLLVKDVVDPATMLADSRGQITRVGNDVHIAWTWAPGMVPPSAAATCIATVHQQLLDWARGWYGSAIDLTA